MSVLAIGQVVYLKSGSPAMTIAEMDDKRETAMCIWHDGTEMHKHWFLVETLQRAKPEVTP